MLLNKFVKESLLQILARKDVSVNMIGNINIYVIVIKDSKGQKIFEFAHKKAGEYSVSVNDERVVNSSLLSGDMFELYDVLQKRIAQDKKEKQIELARKNMRDFDIRAIEFLKQYTK